MIKTIIAGALVGTLTSTGLSADSTIYGRARLAFVDGTDSSLVNTRGIKNISSRFGLKGTEDLTDNLRALYHFEVEYEADETNEPDGPDLTNRIGAVGLTGNFGSLLAGQHWLPSYSLLRSHIDIFHYFLEPGEYIQDERTGDLMVYANSWAEVKFMAAIISDDKTDNVIDGHDIAVELPLGPVSLHLSTGQEKDLTIGSQSKDASHTAIAVKYASGNVTAVLGILDSEDFSNSKGLVGRISDYLAAPSGFTDSFKANVMQLDYRLTPAGSFLFRYADMEIDKDTSADSVTLGYHHQFSDRTALFVETQSGDLDIDGTPLTSAEKDYILVNATAIGLRHNF